MITAAKKRLTKQSDVSFSVADMHELPFDDASFDQALLFNSLTYSAQPRAALAEAARVLRPGGKLVAITLHSHHHRDITRAYSHQNQGFSAPDLRKHLEAAHLTVDSCDLTSRERRKPYFEVVTAFATKSSSPSV